MVFFFYLLSGKTEGNGMSKRKHWKFNNAMKDIYLFFCIYDNRPWHFRCCFFVLLGWSFACHFLGRVTGLFSLSWAKRGFLCLSKICSSFQNREELFVHSEKRFCLFLVLQKVTMVLKTLEMTLQKTLWQFDDSCYDYVDAKRSLVFNSQFHAEYFASLTNQNARFYSTMRFSVKLHRNYTKLCGRT